MDFDSEAGILGVPSSLSQCTHHVVDARVVLTPVFIFFL